MPSTTIEFAVQMTCGSCVDSVKRALEKTPGIKHFEVNLEKESVVIESDLPTLDLQRTLESTGKKVAVKGYAGSVAAVSIMEAGDRQIQGVVRFVQATPDVCVIDGTIDGLKPQRHGIFIHECGDLSKGCESVGDVYNQNGSKERSGDLGVVEVDQKGRASFRLENNVIKLSDIIGRSCVIAEKRDIGDKKLACGIIARSAGLFQNPKKICACDGVTLWDEVSRKPSSL